MSCGFPVPCPVPCVTIAVLPPLRRAQDRGEHGPGAYRQHHAQIPAPEQNPDRDRICPARRAIVATPRSRQGRPPSAGGEARAGPRTESRGTDRAGLNVRPQSLALPDKQNTPALGQSSPSKTFYFTEIRKSRMCRLDPAQGRGAYRDRHERGPGGGGRRSHRRGGFCRAGNRERSRRAHDRCDRVRQNRVVLAPAGWRQALR